MKPVFTCPRRLDKIKGVDDWVVGRWDRLQGPRVYWPPHRAKPRTCSHCHSIHPQDTFALLADGWEDDGDVAGVMIRVRGYLLVPGSRAERVAAARAWFPGSASIESRVMAQPFPLAYFYVAHFTGDQLAALNVLHDDMLKRLPH